MNPTDLPVNAAAVSATPEFVDHRGGRALFAISRSSLYRLAEDGKIRSVCLRNRGKLRGRRLFDCDSIRQFLRGQMEASGQ